MGEFTAIRYESSGHRAYLTIDRPERRNALNVAVMRELREGFARAREDAAVRVVVLTGEGEKAFSAGGDLGGFVESASRVEQHLARGAMADLLWDMTRLGKPIIARVNGHALAGGFGLMCACDIIVAVESAQFGMPEISMGLWPFIISAVVRTAMPERKALEMMMTGARIDAAEAVRLGIINRVAPVEGLDRAVDEMCETLASKSALIMRLGKDSFYASRSMGVREALDYLHGQLGICLDSEDVTEGVTAFFEKRAPVWKGR